VLARVAQVIPCRIILEILGRCSFLPIVWKCETKENPMDLNGRKIAILATNGFADVNAFQGHFLPLAHS
jgi:hypothetical protein